MAAGRESVDLAALAHGAMLERGLAPEVPPEARAQAEALPGPAEDDAAADRRPLPWCSIDNEDSRDLDQLSFGERAPGGGIRLHVAIADVDALVGKGTPIDAHARHNTTSVYTPTRVFHMLPERLSTDLTSLAPGADRLAVVASFTVGPNGQVRGPELARARVHNHAKLAYPSVGDWLEGNGPAPDAVAARNEIADALRLQDEAAQRLRRRRVEDGALGLETIEPRAVLEDSRVVDLRAEPKNRARLLIEDLMIAVNGVTARFLASRGFAALRRVVRSPERWDRLEVLAREYGHVLRPEPEPAALAEFLARRREEDPLRFPDLSLTVVKLLGRGEYIAARPGEDTGHFGLSAKDYTHSTAPNRRYPDLVTQRLVKAALAGAPSPYADDELDALAAHCTRQEDAAEKVERQTRKSAAALLLAPRVGERFEAIVTGASEKGTWVRILQPPVEGKLVRGAGGLDVGDRVRVRLVETDVARGFIDFARSRR